MMQTKRPLFLSSLFALFLACLLSACVKVDQTLTLKPDGSGLFHVRYGMTQKDIAQMKTISEQAMQLEGLTNDASSGSPFDFNEADIRKDFAAYEKSGVTLKDVKISDEQDWKFVDLDIEFKTLAGLSETEFIADRTISLTKMPDGNYEFRQSAPVQGMKPAEMAGLDEASIKSLMAEMMKGFQAKMTVIVPGAIAETSADSHDERSATWSYDLDKDPDALERAQKMDLRVVFSGKDLELKEFKSEGSEM